MNNQFDILIVGGGLVGAAAAVALKLQGYDVALLDKAQPSYEGESLQVWDNRIYAISPENVAWLKRLGVWQSIDMSRVSAVNEMHIWGDQVRQPLCFNAYEANVESLSDIVEGHQLQQALWLKMQQLGVNLRVGIPKTLGWVSGVANISLLDETKISANLLIAADGANSWVRTQAGIQVSVCDYAQWGVVANFEIEKSHQNIARQWFKQGSVLAYLPLADDKMSMVWSISIEHANELLVLSDEALSAQVAEAGHHELGQLKVVTKALAFPLKKQTVTALVKSNLALIGDAAHLVHPLAGQGVNLGFRDVIDLVNTLSLRKPYENLGDLMLLRRYERARKQDILAIKFVTHGLNTLFAQDNLIIKQLRNWGLHQIEHHRNIKQQLIKQAIA